MNQEEINKQIFERLKKLEKAVFLDGATKSLVTPPQKSQTLPELIFGRKFKNGQEKIAVIVGYLEKLKQKRDIQEADIKQGWKDGKFEGNYANELLRRTTKSLVRDLKDGTYDLSQTGEKFFDDFLKSNAGNN